MNNVKMAFINPSKKGLKKGSELKNVPIPIITLAGFLREYSNTELEIIDMMASDKLEKLLDFKPDFVSISSMTMFINDAYKIAKWIRNNLDSKIIIGGVHATALPNEAKKHTDIVVSGEGEKVLLDIVKGKIKEGIVSGPIIENLDEIPIPARDMIDMEFYLKDREQIPGVKARVARLLTSRGCPYRCIFCSNSKRKIPIRFHSAERVVKEVKLLIEKYKIEGLGFLDDSFLMNKERVKKICYGIKKFHLIWDCQTRANLLDLKTLQIMKDAGCIQIGVGFESGSQKMLDIIGKGTTIEQNKKAIDLCKKVGIRVRGCFVFGLPGETEETIKETENFIDENNIDFVSPFLATPYPGTSLWDYCKKNNLIPEKFNWDDFTTGHQVTPFCCDTMNIEKLKETHKRLERKYIRKNYSLFYLLERMIKHPRRVLAFLRS